MLDTVPGDVFADGGDHPRDVINFVRALPMPLASRTELVTALTGAGFTQAGAAWMTTNLTPAPGGQLRWAFDIAGIAEMYKSYEATDLWPLVEEPPLGARIDFVRAERSAFRWSGPDEQRIQAAGAGVHLLRDSGHWVRACVASRLRRVLTCARAPSEGAYRQRAWTGGDPGREPARAHHADAPWRRMKRRQVFRVVL